MQKQKKTFRMPRLRAGWRVLLYLVMFIAAALALVNVACECFSTVFAILCYAVAAVTLAIGSCYLVMDIRYGVKEIIKPKVAANPYASKVSGDYRLRTIVFSVPGLISSILYAVLNGVTGLVSKSPWFGSLAAYYILLGLMRVGAVKQAKEIAQIPEEQMRRKKEIAIYRRNSILFLLMAVVLAGMVVLLECSASGKVYPGFTIYAAAAYTFYRITMSVINMVKVKKRNSPLLTIIRKIGYVDGCVSVLILQTAMFHSFSQGEESLVKLMNGLTGSAVCVMILGLGIQGICAAGKMKGREFS